MHADKQADRWVSAQTHYRAGKTDKAKTLCRQIVRKAPDHAGALHLLGLISRRQGRLDHAVDLLTRSAAALPDNPAILCDLGNALKAHGQYEEAITRHRRVVELAPDSAEALSNLGVTFNAWGRCEDAVDWLSRALVMQPDNIEIRYNLGNALTGCFRLADARNAFETVLRADQDHIRARTNLGVVLKDQGDLAGAEATLGDTIARAPGDADAAWNLGLTRLMSGDYESGWALYERRRDLAGFAMRHPPGPAWDGSPIPTGSTLLIHAEQGLGDTIQFIRYVPLAAAAAGARVVLQCQAPLAALLTGAMGPDIEIAGQDRAPRHAAQAPLMSLPHLLNRPEPLVPEGGAYLTADPARVEVWHERLGESGRRIGLAWQGNPDYRLDRRRSVPLRHFTPLADLPDVQLVALQKSPGTEQIAPLPWHEKIHQLGDGLDADGAFLDTAAVMTELDLVVTSDTAIAHLAGALGVPVWLLLADVPDWRWGLAGDTSPWYPTMRLFRQTSPGDWDGVLSAVATEIGSALSP